ncbi:hypothetical protein EDB85DRAFT_1896403 [Lactarius pseudohatsudake]|nr:hypothetical protein EDB85DRAFT_1896403 [Lactarius pseudohatsudake]
MDAPKPPPIVTQSLKRKDRSPSPARRTPSHTSSTAGSRPSPTSLPSIRHFLPQPDVQQLNERYHSSRQPRQPHPPGPAFSAGPSAGIPRLEFLPPPAHASVERTHSGVIVDSDGDGDSEQATRPKQKRRRQALSCTECKRRKIKCDSDKYVSRAEYDELKIRVDRLEAMLSYAQPSTGLAAPPCSETSPHQQHQHQQQQSARPLGAATSAAGHRAHGPGPAPQVPYHPLSPPIIPGQTPAGLAGPSRAVGSGGTAQDYGSSLALRGPNSPPGRTALPPLASLANGPVPFDGPPLPGPLPPRSLHRERDRDRDRDRDHASDHQQQQRHGESCAPVVRASSSSASAAAAAATTTPADKKLPRADAHPAGRAPAPLHHSPRPSGRRPSSSSPPQHLLQQQAAQQQQPPPQTPPISARSPGPLHRDRDHSRLPPTPPPLPRATAQRSAVRDERGR